MIRTRFYSDVPRLGDVEVSRGVCRTLDKLKVTQEVFEKALYEPEQEHRNGLGTILRECSNLRLVIIETPIPFTGSKLIKEVYFV